MARKRRKEAFKAWLVTWEYQGWELVSRQKHRGPSRIAAVLNSRWSGRRVAQIVRLLYVNEFFDPRMRLSATRFPASEPEVSFGRLDGAPWEGRIRCGGTPYLYARLVEDLQLAGEGHKDEYTWKEIPAPQPR